MSAAAFEVQLVAVLVAVACALPGVFLVLRRMALLSDAISHAILLGIVLAFFWTHDLGSPLLLLGASLVGLLTVGLVELLRGTRLLKEDAAIGLVFPALFSLGVILVSRYAGNIHLDTDVVVMGEIAFTPFDRISVAGRDLGPRAMWIMGGVLLLNLGFILILYKELKLTTFDSGLALAMGFSPALLHYGLMGLVSFTAVGAFEAVGSILVLAFMIGPPATAYLLTDRLSEMLGLSALLAALSALLGGAAAHWTDTSIAGSMAVATGGLFLMVLAVAPRRGLLAGILRRRRQRWSFALDTLLIHLVQHEGQEDEARVEHLVEHFHWSPGFAQGIMQRGRDQGLLQVMDGRMAVMEPGRQAAARALSRV